MAVPVNARVVLVIKHVPIQHVHAYQSNPLNLRRVTSANTRSNWPGRETVILTR